MNIEANDKSCGCASTGNCESKVTSCPCGPSCDCGPECHCGPACNCASLALSCH